ncbi:MAG TPA: flagellar biosynthetic protein FliO [Acidimicrobiia bacterium]|jgi:flagellar biogenesis protein FliO|nr:flagellar biosynthetic protein FliO [Acidimicrobiia bacterium]
MDTSLAVLVVRVVVSLGVVLAVMAGAAAVLRRSGVVGTAVSGRRGARRRSAPVEVIARHGLSRGASVTVLRLGGRALVLGVTEHQVSLLTEIDPAELDAPLDENPEIAGPAGPGIGAGALPWKVALEQLRERTVRRS